MNTNDPNNPMTSGTGGGANYGSSNTGTGLGNSGLTSNESTSYGAGTDYSGGAGGSTSSDAQTLDSTTQTNAGPPTTPAGSAEGNTTGYGSNSGSSATGSTYGTSTPTTDDYDYREGGTTSGMFKDRSSAERAYQALHERGYHKDDVHLMMSDDTRKTHFGDNNEHTELGDKAMEGAGVGSAIGGTAGAIIGAIAAIGTSVALPGLGLIIAGPLAAALAGAGAGGLTGGLVGALVGSGIPEEHAVEYEEGIKNGGIVMGVKPRNAEDAKYFEESFKKNSADKVYRY